MSAALEISGRSKVRTPASGVLSPGLPDDPHAAAPTMAQTGQTPTGQTRLHSRLSNKSRKSHQHPPSSPRHSQHPQTPEGSRHVQHSRHSHQDVSEHGDAVGPSPSAAQATRSSNNAVDKPLPSPPNVTTPASLSPSPISPLKNLNPPNARSIPPKLTLRSRFNTGPGPTSPPGNILYAGNQPNKGSPSQHVAAEVSPTALTARPPGSPPEKSTYYHPTTGDRWPFLDAAPESTPGSAPLRSSQQRSSVPSGVETGQKVFPEEEQEGPSDYELFIRRAQEADRHYREQLLRFIPRRSKDGAEAPKQRSSAPRMFSWQRAVAKRQQQEQDQRRSWQAGEHAEQHPVATAWRKSDAGPVTPGGLRRKGSRSSLSSIKQAIAHYIKPPRPPSARDE